MKINEIIGFKGENKSLSDMCTYLTKYHRKSSKMHRSTSTKHIRTSYEFHILTTLMILMSTDSFFIFVINDSFAFSLLCLLF